MALAITEVAAPRRSLILVEPEPPEPVKLPLGKNGRPKHSPSCRTCKSKVGHKQGCKLYAESIERLRQWRRYDADQRRKLGDSAFFTTTFRRVPDLPYFNPACQVCGESDWPMHHSTYKRSHTGYGYSKEIPREADHDFVAGLTPGLHPLCTSNSAVRYGPDVDLDPPLIVSDEVKAILRTAGEQMRERRQQAMLVGTCECGWSFEAIERYAQIKAEHEASAAHLKREEELTP